MDPAILRHTDFSAIDREQWLARVGDALGGEALAGHTDDGIAIDPLPDRSTRPAPAGRTRPEAGWAIVQRVDDPDPRRANEQALADLRQGANGLALVFAGAPNAFGYGLPATQQAVATALENIPLQNLHLRMDVHPQSRASIDWLVQFLGERRADPARMNLSFGIDPAALFAGTGRLRMSIEALEASMPQSLAGFFAMNLSGVLLEADGRVFHNAGASEGQELGIMLASAASHLRMFEQARQPLVYAAPHIGFALCVDQDQFLSMAKIRALRRLWARVLEACSIEPSPTSIHAETSYRMTAFKDPETNILRATIAAFGAAAGGADSISVLAHTTPHGLPDAFARRLARNTQLILAGESRIDFVDDPAAGAGGVETLTDSLCEVAWEEFRRIEGEGGALRSLAAGRIQERVAAMRHKRAEAFRSGERTIVGTTLYPSAEERHVTTLAASAAPPLQEGTVFCEPLGAMRIDETIGEAA